MRPLSKYFFDLGIIHTIICSHSNHQNGLVERKHCHLVEAGLTLAHAQLPMKYWDHDFLTTVSLMNRLPTLVLEHKSPFQVLYNKIPDYKLLKVFGA